MKKGLALLKEGKILPSGNQLAVARHPDQLEDLTVEFWNDSSMTSAPRCQERYAEIIGTPTDRLDPAAGPSGPAARF